MMPRKHAPIVAVGASLDESGWYMAIEQDDKNRLLCEYIDEGGSYLPLGELRVPTGDVDRRVVDKELEDAEHRAYVAIAELMPDDGEIVDYQIVATHEGQVAYVTEIDRDHEKLFLYSWTGNVWQFETYYVAVGVGVAPVETFLAQIQNVYVEYNDEEPDLLVVEESRYIRWWHSYTLGRGEWVYMYSRQMFLEHFEKWDHYSVQHVT